MKRNSMGECHQTAVGQEKHTQAQLAAFTLAGQLLSLKCDYSHL